MSSRIVAADDHMADRLRENPGFVSVARLLSGPDTDDALLLGSPGVRCVIHVRLVDPRQPPPLRRRETYRLPSER